MRIFLAGLVCAVPISTLFAQEPSRPSRDSDSVATLKPVEVTARPLDPAEVRRRDSQGRFLARHQLARVENRRFGDVVRSMGGVRVITESGAAYAVTNRGRNTIYGANARCFMQVYLDGALVYSGGDKNTAGLEMRFDLNQLLTSDVDHVELYASAAEIPAEYNRTGSTCGVLRISTRQR